MTNLEILLSLKSSYESYDELVSDVSVVANISKGKSMVIVDEFIEDGFISEDLCIMVQSSKDDFGPEWSEER